MNELFEKIKKILEINKYDIKIENDWILIHINLYLSIRISKQLKSELTSYLVKNEK